ncbi:UDP-N-acetylmuramate dehydrogenase [Candidatus Nomurabacteria bacterium]|nr:UDP-N-acetylmuramate dehydrogenase [Candidatus Nomurabacteria bacterium]
MGTVFSQKQVSLKPYNTLSVDVTAEYFAYISSADQLGDIVKSGGIDIESLFVLGRGSNTLLTKNYPGLVLLNSIKGIKVINEDENSVTLEIGSGEDWPSFVEYAVSKGWSGLENLAYIPGTVGAAPVQNIGAYGQAFEDIFVDLDAVDLTSGEIIRFTKEESKLGYRTSAFKTDLKDKYFIVVVRVRLSKDPHFDTSYHSRFPNESLSEWLKKNGKPPYTPADVAHAVTGLRKFKLPDPKEVGTCGSFFVNPFVTVDKFHELEKEVNELQHYPVTKMEYDRIDWHNTGQDKIVKIPAGRLLDELGWKGKWIGNVGTHDKQALCVITNKKASGQEVLDYTNKMRESVQKAYGIDLVSEVRIV